MSNIKSLASKSYWWIAVSPPPDTEVNRITFWWGSANWHLRDPFYAWGRHDPDWNARREFDVPSFERFGPRELWIKGLGDPEGRNANFTVYFMRHKVRDFSFDGGDGEDADMQRPVVSKAEFPFGALLDFEHGNDAIFDERNAGPAHINPDAVVVSLSLHVSNPVAGKTYRISHDGRAVTFGPGRWQAVNDGTISGHYAYGSWHVDRPAGDSSLISLSIGAINPF